MSEERNDGPPPADTALVVAASTEKQPPPVRPRSSAILFLTVAGASAALLMVLMSSGGVPASPATSLSPPSATAAPAVEASNDASGARTEDAAQGLTAPVWTVSTPSRSRGASSATTVFELQAERDVQVWKKRVRPVLTIRCDSTGVEAFVITYSAASIEPETTRHTVQVALDGKESAQLWEHSVDHDALFAPDGAALARQIASAKQMTFTFTPFNASPAVATFAVAGFDGELGNHGQRCRSARPLRASALPPR